MRKIFSCVMTIFMVMVMCGLSAMLFMKVSADFKTDDQHPQGSGTLLTQKNLVVSIYAEDNYSAWSRGEKESKKSDLKETLEYVEKQAQRYGKNTDFIYDRVDLNLEWSYNGIVDDASKQDFEKSLYKYISRDIDSDELMDKYNADGIIYAVLINKAGTSYSHPYYYNRSDSAFDETVYLYADSDEKHKQSPEFYAKQILRLYGASDLAEVNVNEGITADVISIFKKDDPSNLMSLAAAGDKAESGICDFTAYQLGLIDDPTVIVQTNEKLLRQYVGAFKYLA